MKLGGSSGIIGLLLALGYQSERQQARIDLLNAQLSAQSERMAVLSTQQSDMLRRLDMLEPVPHR